MTDKVYLLKHRKNDGQYFGKFFTSPFTAMAKIVRLSQESDMFSPGSYVTEMFGVDMDDFPCDHIAIEKFTTDIINHVHRSTHRHGFVLIEKHTCIYEVLMHGESVGEVLIIYLPPSFEEGSVMDLGDLVVRTLAGKPDKIADLHLIIQQFWDSGC